MDDFNIVINDDDIQWIKKIMPDIEFDDSRINVLKNMTGIDINACPGSGKTTLLVAKLAILANKWKDKNRGICVLSHTNVAREEIQDRLGSLDVGKKLLSYPHFIGTFQSFIDTFISMPYIRSVGLSVNTIDTDFVTECRWKRLTYKTKSYLERKHKDKMVFDPVQTLLDFNVNCSKETNTYKDIVNITTDSRAKGEFTFKEMELYAVEAIEKNPNICKIFQKRFPFLFIDEAQDTKPEIWDLIHKLYQNACENIFYQAYGDSNQAIFDSYKSSFAVEEFPRTNHLQIVNSKRFINSIATLANGVAVDESVMKGEGKSFINQNPQHTIFLFSHGQENNVLQKYAELILNTFSDEELHKNEKYGCHVLGMVHKLEKKDDEIAVRLSNYFPEYNPEIKKSNPVCLIDYFYVADEKFSKTNELSDKLEWICKGLLKLINICQHSAIKYSNTAFKTIVNMGDNNIRKFLLKLCKMDYRSKNNWDEIINFIINVFSGMLSQGGDYKDFILWKSNNESEDIKKIRKKCNKKIFNDSVSGRSVELNFGSIHSSKGRTHLSTLIVETKFYEYNMKSIIKWLSGEKGMPKGINIERLKCQYVAMTRAKGLLCLALLKDTVTIELKNKLIKFGWNIVTV